MSNEIFKRKTVISVDYCDLECFIEEETGQRVCIVSLVERSNDTDLRYNIDGDLDEYAVDDWNNFKSSGSGCCLQVILDGLCSEGKIEAGEYLVGVSW
jgi:hypothetical protein